MEFDISECGDTARKVILRGRGDAPGIDSVETRFTAALSGAGRSAAVDLSAVPFMGSLGIRMLISVARVLSRRGSKMVLFGVQPMVMDVFETVALADIIPIASTEAEAMALLGA